MPLTPGPWDVFPNPTTGKVTIGPVESHSNLVRCVAECYADAPDNYNAVAALPELLEAAERAYRVLAVRLATNRMDPDNARGNENLVEVLRAAIAKARGTT